MLRLILLSTVAVFSTGCAGLLDGNAPAVAPSVCPAFPAAGPEVADELAAVDAAMPAVWSWLDRLHTLDEQLQACRGG